MDPLNSSCSHNSQRLPVLIHLTLITQQSRQHHLGGQIRIHSGNLNYLPKPTQPVNSKAGI